MTRWIAIINYRTNGGTVYVQHELEELADLQDIVERGPHWDAIECIVIARRERADVSLTVEKAEAL